MKRTTTKKAVIPKDVLAVEFLNRQYQVTKSPNGVFMSKLKEWIEKVLEKKLPFCVEDPDEEWDLQRAIKKGDIICEVMEKIKSGSIPHIHQEPLGLKIKENILFFIQAVEDLDIFLFCPFFFS